MSVTETTSTVEATTIDNLSNSLDFGMKLDLEKVLSKYGRGATWDETSRKAFSDFLHHFLIYTLMNRAENQRKVFTLKSSSEGFAITNYMKEHTPENVERAELSDPDNYTSGDLFQEISTENVSAELKPHAHSECIKAIYKFTNCATGEQTVTNEMIHLTFDFEIVKEFILKYFEFHQDVFCKEVKLECICAGFASLLEYISAEIIEISSAFQEEDLLTLTSLKKGLKSDPALSSLPCSHIILSELP